MLAAVCWFVRVWSQAVERPARCASALVFAWGHAGVLLELCAKVRRAGIAEMVSLLRWLYSRCRVAARYDDRGCFCGCPGQWMNSMTAVFIISASAVRLSSIRLKPSASSPADMRDIASVGRMPSTVARPSSTDSGSTPASDKTFRTAIMQRGQTMPRMCSTVRRPLSLISLSISLRRYEECVEYHRPFYYLCRTKIGCVSTKAAKQVCCHCSHLSLSL